MLNPDKSEQRFGVASLAAGQTIVWACLFYVFPALLLRWESDFEWTKVQLTGAITLALFVSAVFSPLVGRQIDRGHGPQIMAVGAMLGGVCVFLVSFVISLWQMYFLWGVIGLSFAACLYEPCFIMLTRGFGARAKSKIILVTLVAGFASTISFPLAHHISELWGWRAVTQIFGAAALFVGVPLMYFGAVSVERNGLGEVTLQQHSPDKISYLRNPVFLNIAVAFALLALVHGITLHHLLHILTDRGLALGSAVFIASLIGPMQVVGRLFLTALRSSVSHRKIAYSCFVCMAMSMGLLYLMGWLAAWGFGVAILFVMVFGGGYGLVSIIRCLLYTSPSPRDRG